MSGDTHIRTLLLTNRSWFGVSSIAINVFNGIQGKSDDGCISFQMRVWGGVKKQPFNIFCIQVLLDNFQSFLSSISSLNFIIPTTNLSQPGLPLILSVIRKIQCTYTRHINWHRDVNIDRARRVQLVVNATPSELCITKSRAKNTK